MTLLDHGGEPTCIKILTGWKKAIVVRGTLGVRLSRPTVRGGGLVVPRVAIILGQHSFSPVAQYIWVLVKG